MNEKTQTEIKTTCFACGSVNIKTGWYSDTINDVEVSLRIDSCLDCETEGDFADINDSIIEKAGKQNE